ncbi:MAG TPA: CHAT domain-containing protein [Anaerolineae bacterium]|nr:CHAT domain-containing protein [Anaerolineae bacterium]
MSLGPTYADVEIRILGKQKDGYPLEMTVNSEQEFPRGYLSADFLPWISSSSPLDDGQRLFEWLVADNEIKTAWAQVRGQHSQRRIRLRIDAAAPELHAIPWELMRDTDDGSPAQDLAAADSTPMSRYMAGQWQPGSPILKRPVRMLVAVASPENLEEYGLSAIDVEAEWALLREELEGLEIKLVQLPQPCTLHAVEEELRKGYHILHLVAHGQFDEGTGQAFLYLADEDGQVQGVHETEFAEMVARQLAGTDLHREDKLRLVFLASCQSATCSPADAFRGLAPSLVSAGVPAVLAMQDLVAVDTAREFAHTFYRQLLEHGLVDLAANQARSALLTAGLSGVAIPVLFMRLRSGELLGWRGRISSAREELFWPFLLENIEQGRCTPFLGPRVNAGLLPSTETAAEKLADKYGYPLGDCRSLIRVAQFISIHDPDVLRDDYLRLLQRNLFPYLGLRPTEEEKQRFRKASFTETAKALDWAERVLAVQENEIHHLLAELPLPLYVTTNPDSFMVEALEHRGRSPRRLGPRWEPRAGSPQYILSPKPSPDEPVVLHLNGHDGDPEQRRHLVLSEDDYLVHFVRIARDQDTILPMNILSEISQHCFLFLGYNTEDWAFRVILQGLLKPIAQTGGAKLHVGVQLEVSQTPNADRMIDYLQRYLGRFNIEIYWGTPQQFVTELHAHWQEYLEAEDETWDF